MDTDMNFAWIPPGHFLMGGNGIEDNPQHRVTITKGLWMGIFPVTQAQWQAVMGYNPSNFRGDNRPVEMVSWQDCQEFCEKMKQLTGKPIRLPTEAEWEYACRAGTTSEYWNGNGKEALEQIGWFNGNSGNQTHSAGEKKTANPWGLFDVHGNVWEWCQDLYCALDTDNTIDPLNNENEDNDELDGGERVARGGAWGEVARDHLAACRTWGAPDVRDKFSGFRVCFCLD